MAVWQFALDLIPAAAARVAGIDAIRLSQEQLEGLSLQLTEADAADLSARLAALLPGKPSWNADLRLWGDEKSNDVQIWFDGETVASVQFRLDLSTPSIQLVDGICAIARRLGCVLVTGDGAVLQPNGEAIVRAALQSSAARFVDDPDAFLAEAARLDSQD